MFTTPYCCMTRGKVKDILPISLLFITSWRHGMVTLTTIEHFLRNWASFEIQSYWRRVLLLS